MPLAPSLLSRARTSLLSRLGVVLVGCALATGSLTVATAPDAHASPAGATQQDSGSHMTARERFAAKAERVLHVTANQKGDPYRYGATGPNAFDCSGLTYFVFRKALGRSIPRVANDQKRASKRIWHRRNLRPGDLVFQVNGSGYAYHVGIYAGHGYFWHSPHSGSHVKKERMYPSHWRFGRIIRT